MSKRKRVERELTDDERELLSAVGRCCRELSDFLAGARRRAEKSASAYVSDHIGSTLHRGIESYADMLEKLKVPDRKAVDRLLAKHLRMEEVQDVADEIAETEGCWRNFLANLERDLDLGLSEEELEFDQMPEVTKELDEEEEEQDGGRPKPCPYRSLYSETLVPDLMSLKLVDPRTSRGVKMSSLLEPYRILMVICLPAYLPHAVMRRHFSLLDKLKDDLSYFRCGVIGITWGQRDHGKRWSKEVKSSFPIYLDTEEELVDLCGLSRGLSKIWGSATLMYLAELQRAKVAIDLPPENVKWNRCLNLGCAFVLAAPEKKKQSPKMLLFHRSKDSVGDLPDPRELRQVALEHFCSVTGQTADSLLVAMERERRYRNAPDPSRLQLEPSSGMYYDAITRLYYDPRSQYYYDGESGQYVYWNAENRTYVSAQHLYAAGPNYYHVRAMMEKQEADIYAKAVAIVDAREKGVVEEEEDREGELKPPGT